MTKLPPDAGTVCTALELDAGFLADVFKREAATALHQAAQRLLEGSSTLVEQLDHARHLLLVADAFEAEWELRESDEAVERNGGDSPTPPPPPSRDEIVAESGTAGAAAGQRG
jgi:hypothetical protein